MSRIFAIAGVVVASLVVGGLVLGWLLLPGLSESAIKQVVARDTGRSISFAGKPRLSVWPELAIELRDVELSNPPDMAEGRFAAADTVRLKVSGGSLWRRTPEIAEIVVVRPRINLLVDSEGRSNFALERDGEDRPAAPAPIVVVDGSIKYLNERSAAVFAASDVDLTLSQAGLAGPLELDGAFNWNDQRMILAFHARSSARLAADGSPADFTISGPYLDAAFSGRAAIKEGLELAGTLEFKAAPLADLLSWAGHASALTGSLPALTASGGLDLSRGAIRMTKAQITLGEMNAQGDIALRFAGAKPRITGNLGVDRIAFDGGDGLAGAWSEAPIDLSFLEAVDAELSLAVSELGYGKLVAGATRLDVALEDGVLDVALMDSELYGGSASGRLMLDGSGPLTALEARIEASGLDGGKLAAGGIRGITDIDFDVTAKGASRQELVARLAGRGHLRVHDGVLSGLDVPAMLAHVKTGIAEGWTAAGDDETSFSKLEASFVVEDGIAETEDLRLDGPVAEVTGSGSVDLLRRRLDLRVSPQIVGKEKAAPLPVAVVIAGDWSTPTIHPDIDGILEDPKPAYQALRKRMLMDAAKLDLWSGNGEMEPGEAAATR